MLQPTGMVTTSATNPLDEIPIGPQVFPYGTPSLTQSQVEPYLATNYGNSSTLLQSTTSALPATSVTTEAYPSTVYQAPVQQVVEVPTVQTVPVTTTYQTVTPVLQSSIQYQNVTRLQPVKKLAYVPRVVTKYVPMVDNSGVSPVVSTTGSFGLQTPLVQSTLLPTTSHFARNVPVYENDPRRSGFSRY